MDEERPRHEVTVLREVLELPVVRRGLPKVLYGLDCLDREVAWAHVLEFPDPSRLLRGGELVLTAGMGMGREPRQQRRWVEAVAEQQAAGLVVELGLTFAQHLPRTVIDASRGCDLPLVALSRRVAFVEVTRAITELTLARHASVTWRADELQAHLTELVLSGQGAIEVLDELAMRIAAPVAYETASGELVHCASGPVPAGIALRALDDYRRYPSPEGAVDGAFVAPLPGSGRSAGRLIVLGIERPPDELQRVAVERAASVVALEQLNRRHAEQLHVRTRGALLSDLASGRGVNVELVQRARMLGFHTTRRNLVPFVMRRRSTGSAAGDVPDQVWQEIATTTRETCAARGVPTLIGIEGVEVLGLAAPGDGTPPEAAFGLVADAVHDVIARHALDERSVILAFGALSRGWESAGSDLRRAIRCAGAATTAPPQRWYDARHVGVRELLYELRGQPELEAFALEQLGGLLNSGADRSGVLLATLRAYVAAHGRKSTAARALHLDRTALYGRLRRIEACLGVDLDDHQALLGLELAFEVLAMRGGDASSAIQRPS